jgi:hypothetical protein
MQTIIKLWLIIIASASLLTSCGNLSTDVENKLNELKSKSESLDSMLTKEVNKVYALDTLINTEHVKVKQLDSIIQSKTKLLQQLTQKAKFYSDRLLRAYNCTFCVSK